MSAVSLTYQTGTKRRNYKPRQGSVNQFDTGKKQEPSGFKKGDRRCFRCGSSSHMVMNCPIKHNKVGNITSGSYSRSQSNSPVQGRSRSLSPYPWGRLENSDRGRLSARNKRERTTGRKSEHSNDANATYGACSLYNNRIVDTKVSVGLLVLFAACKTEPTSMPVTEGWLGPIKISV